MRMFPLVEFVLVTFGCSLSAAYMKLAIYPVDHRVVLKKNSDLILTCKALGDDANNTYNLSWILPLKESDTINRVSFNKSQNTLILTVLKVRKSDTGQYICEIDDGDIKRREKISVVVNTEREVCFPPFFDCGRMLCIPLHYVCDGFRDCPDGTDESHEHCGHDVCKGKFFCNGRCIDKNYCCDPMVDLNCSVHYIIPCCQRYINDVLPMDIFEIESSEAPVQYTFNNLLFYQSTFYTMISCAIAFIFLSTTILVAMCHIRMRRNTWLLQSTRLSHQPRFRRNPASPAEDENNHLGNENRTASCLQHCPGRHGTLDPMENFVLLTYDNNTGVETAEYGPKPPPYAESNVGIPPPPYCSSTDVSATVMD